MCMKVKDFEKIEKLIEETKDIYEENAFTLDRMGSECKKCFLIKCKSYAGYIVFDSVEQFEKWIKG